MVNSDEFRQRLERILSHYELTASAFADTIGVQRSSISHLLSGRNKPSLDFVLKVVEHFPQVNIYWLLNGKGHFPPAPETENAPPVATGKPGKKAGDRVAEKIVVFYSDGTFESYLPGSRTAPEIP